MRRGKIKKYVSQKRKSGIRNYREKTHDNERKPSKEEEREAKKE